MNENLYIQQLELGGMANFSYLIGDKSTGDAAVVDPNDDTEAIEAVATKAGITVKLVLLTHGHYDHTGGLKYYADKKSLPVYLSKDEFMLYVPHCKTLKRIGNNEKIAIGTFEVTCLHTPGHTPGCVCFHIEDNLFTGDTLFVDAIGRTDLPGGNSKTIFKSLQLLKGLPPETTVWPGHNYGHATHECLKTLCVNNPFLACTVEQDFLALTG